MTKMDKEYIEKESCKKRKEIRKGAINNVNAEKSKAS